MSVIVSRSVTLAFFLRGGRLLLFGLLCGWLRVVCCGQLPSLLTRPAHLGIQNAVVFFLLDNAGRSPFGLQFVRQFHGLRGKQVVGGGFKTSGFGVKRQHESLSGFSHSVLLLLFSVFGLSDSGLGLRLYAAEGAGREVEVSLNGKASWAMHICEFGQCKVSPLLTKPHNISEEDELAIFQRAFGGIPGPVRIRRKELDKDGRVFVLFLGIERRQDFAQLFSQEFHCFSLPPSLSFSRLPAEWVEYVEEARDRADGMIHAFSRHAFGHPFRISCNFFCEHAAKTFLSSSHFVFVLLLFCFSLL